MGLNTKGSGRFNTNIWPGFVDAMTGLLLVLMFVLTIFTVIQFVLRETISGQEDKLSELSGQIAALADALGLERDRSAELGQQVGSLTTSLADVQNQSDAQAALIATLTAERDSQAAALVDAQNKITGFEVQVAGLLAQRADLRDQVAGLEADKTQLMSDAEALNLALAQARTEIDAGVEAARLAAARREALEALLAQTQAESDGQKTRIDELEAAQLADAAAAEALRARLADADTEITAMTLALEEQRRKAEDTLTLLAATQAARDQLDMNLAAALLAQQQAENDLTAALSKGDDLDARLAAALSLQESTAAELEQARAALDAASADRDDLATRLAAALAAGDTASADLEDIRQALADAMNQNALTQTQLEGKLAQAILDRQAAEAELASASANAADAASRLSDLEQRLAEALVSRQALTAQVAALSEGRSDTDQSRADLEARLASALADLAATKADQTNQMTEAERQAVLLAEANRQLSDEKALSAESQRQVALLNEQVAQLRTQVGSLQALLDIADQADQDAKVQIQALGSQLNTALARVAAEERRRRELEEAERARLEEERARLAAEAQDLERYKSEFFGRMRDVVAGQDGIQIVGDRFVFSSEVLFPPGSADLSEAGKAEIAKVAALLRQIAAGVPEGIDWVIRVDGHTDNVPLSGTGRYRDNWELSQGRALSVVRYMVDNEGIPPNRLAANGFGEFQPINTADTDAARAQNRRIELKLTER